MTLMAIRFPRCSDPVPLVVYQTTSTQIGGPVGAKFHNTPASRDENSSRDIPFIIVQREPYRDRNGAWYFSVMFECPYCFTSYRLDGRPRKNSRHRWHNHGESSDWDGRPTHRWAHCYSETPFTDTGYFLAWEGYAGLSEFTEAAA